MKAKNNENALGLGTFLVMWVIASALGWLAAFILYELDFLNVSDNGSIPYVLLLAIVPGLPLSILQARFVAPKFSIAPKFWLSVSAVGLLGSAGVLYYVMNTYIDFPEPKVLIATLFAPVAIVQWLFLLKGRVNAGWLWVVSAIISALVFGYIGDVLADISRDGEALQILLTAGVQSLVTGGVMWWLMQQPQTKAKKVKAAS